MRIWAGFSALNISLNVSVEGYGSGFVFEGLGFESLPGHLLPDVIHGSVRLYMHLRARHSRLLLHPFQFTAH
jgi:hypothetical protein